MNNRLKKHKINAEYIMVYLFIMLFYISFIESYRLLAITGVIVITYALISCKNKDFIKFIKPVLPFVILMLLPISIGYMVNGTLGDVDFAMKIVCKILLSSIILGAIVSKHSDFFLVDGILNIGFPDIFNRILALTFRYFYMINEDVKKGRQALSSRGIGERKGLYSLSIFGEWIGGFFLKSCDHSDRVFNAMKSRGYDGESRNKNGMNKALIAKAGMLAVLLVVVLIFDRKV